MRPRVAEAFNPYREWLGLEAPRPDFYQLLALAPGESDAGKISLAAEQAARKVRSFRPGPNAAAWSHLLDEIQAAKECLLDPQRRAEYDRRLRQADASPQPAKPTATREQPRPAPRPQNEEMYPPGMGRREPAAQEQPARGAPPRSDLDPPVRPAAAPAAQPRAAQPADAQPIAAQPAYPLPDAMPAAGVPHAAPTSGYATAGLPLALPVAAPGPPYAAPAAGYGGYAPSAADPMAPVAAGGMASPQAAYAAPQYAAPQYAAPQYAAPQCAAPQYAAPMAAYSAPPAAVPYALPPASAAPYAAAPYAAAPTAYASSPMPLGAAPAPAPLPQAASPAGEPIIPASRPSAAALARKNEAQSQRALVIGGVTVAGLLLLSAILYVAATSGDSEVAQNPSPPVAPSTDVNSDPGELQPIERSAESKLSRPGGADKTPRRTPQSSPPPEVRPASPIPMPVEHPPAEMTPEPSVAVPSPMPAAPSPVPLPAPEPAPTPMPPPMPEPPAAITRAEAMALSQALIAARTALSEMNFAETEAELAKADALAKLPKHREMVARLREVTQYVQQFRQALADAVMQLDGGDVITVGSSTMVAFVEGQSDRVVLRIQGMNRVYPFNDMPPGLAVAIADLKLDAGDPVSRVVKGAYYLTTKRTNDEAVARARTWWEEARLAGAPIDHLMPLLSDKYDDLVKDATP